MPKKKSEPTAAARASSASTDLAAPNLRALSTSKLELRYLDRRSDRQLAELLGAEQVIDHVAKVLVAGKAAQEAAESAKKALVAQASQVYFAQEAGGQPFDTVHWRGKDHPLGVSVVFSDRSKALSEGGVATARASLGDELLKNFVEESLVVELEGPIAGWALTHVLGTAPADAAFGYDARSSIELRGPIAAHVLDRIPDATTRADVKAVRGFRLVADFDAVRRRLIPRLTREQLVVVQSLRAAGCASPSVEVVKEKVARDGVE